MDTKRLDEVGIQPLQADLDRIAALSLPGTSAALGDLSGRLQMAYGVSPLVNAVVTTDAKNSSANLLMIVAGQQSLDLDDYAKPENQRVRDLYLAYIGAMLRSTGLSAPDAEAAARTVLAIETEISAAQLTPLQSRDPAVTYNIMTLAEAQALIPAVDLQAQLKAMGVTPPATVQVRDIAALKAVNKVLATRSAEEIRTLLRWNVLTGRASALGQPWRGLDEDFNRQRLDLQAAPPRERQVTNEITTAAVLATVEAVRRDLLPRKHAARHHADGGPHQGRVRAPAARQPLARRAHPCGGAGQAGQGRHPGGLPAAVDRLQPHRHPAG